MRIRALLEKRRILKIMFSKKATKIDEIFTVDLMLCSKRQIDSEDFVNFHGLLRKYELYNKNGETGRTQCSKTFKFSLELDFGNIWAIRPQTEVLC